MDWAAEGHMRLPYLAAAKARSGDRQSYVGWSVVEPPVINRPGARPQRNCRQRRSVELDAMGGKIADRQEQLQTLQPEVCDILVGDTRTTADQPVACQLEGKVEG